MKNLILAATLFAAATATVTAQAQVNVSVSIGQPNFYGRIDVLDYPPPQLIYAQPLIVQRPVHYVGRPIYLRVPPGHAKNWSRHCRAYNACNQEVYFVQDNWYRNQYAPRYRQQHEHHTRPAPPRAPHHDGRPGPSRPHQSHGKPDRHDHDGRPGHGNGRGNGHGHGNGGGHDRGNDRRN